MTIKPTSRSNLIKLVSITALTAIVGAFSLDKYNSWRSIPSVVQQQQWSLHQDSLNLENFKTACEVKFNVLYTSLDKTNNELTRTNLNLERIIGRLDAAGK